MKTSSDIKSFFKDKEITMIGLGLLGRGVGVVKFLAEMGARLTVTDLKSKSQLRSSLDRLKKYKDIKYILGHHRLEDFRNKDMIIKAAGVPLNSPYILEADKNKIPVKMDASLFAKLSPATIIGVTGTRGKSTTACLIYEILKKAGRRVFIGGNIKGLATLPLLKRVKAKDIVVLELDSWQLQGFGSSRLSPHIAIFTSFMPDHLNYYKNNLRRYFQDKAKIFKYQNKSDYLVTNKDTFNIIKKLYPYRIKSRARLCSRKNIFRKWNLKLRGEHNLANIALATETASILKINDDIIKKAVENFAPLPGRLELIKTCGGVAIYNDTNSTTPDAVMAGLKALARNKNIILIMGGSDKGLKLDELIGTLPQYCKSVFLTPGTGTDRIRSKLKRIGNILTTDTKTLKESVRKAMNLAERGDIILFSPGFTSFGIFKNEYDRGDRFNKIISRLK